MRGMQLGHARLPAVSTSETRCELTSVDEPSAEQLAEPAMKTALKKSYAFVPRDRYRGMIVYATAKGLWSRVDLFLASQSFVGNTCLR